jgi:outer membrane receptor protein involved in Fe transport
MSKTASAIALSICLLAIGLVPNLSRHANAQSAIAGGIGGTVTDALAAAIPGAIVTALNTGTNQKWSSATDGSGYFRTGNLTPGAYKLTVSAPGFDSYVTSVIVEVGRLSDVEPRLRTGANQENVEVTADRSLINADAPDLSTNFNQKQIQDLPINGRHWTSFALLAPGVSTGDSNFGAVSVRGMSNLQNNFLVDGSDDNQAFDSVERGYSRVGYSTSQEAIQEFQVNTSNYSAQYGRAAGGGVNAITKSGSNEFHGSAFWYDRDNQFGATNPFTLLNGVSIKPKDKRQQFGGSFSGPIIRDRLFFFYVYDQQVRLFPIVATPTAGFINSEANQGAIARSRGVNPSAIASAYSYLDALTGIIPRKGNQSINFPKLDWKINDRNSVSVSYNRMRWASPGGIQSNPVIQRGITSSGNDYVHVDAFVGNWTSTLRSNVVNTLRYEFARDYEFETPQTPAAIEPTTGPGGLPPETFINTQSGFYIGTPDYLPRAKYPNEQENQIIDTVTWIKGNHTITPGFDFRRVYDDIDNINPGIGEFTYSGTNALADFVTDYSNYKSGNGIHCDAAHDSTSGPNPCYNNIQQAFGLAKIQFATNEYAAFLQDDWKLRPNLTLNLGIRYDYEQLPFPQLPNSAVASTTSFPSDKTAISPRFGVAYDPFRNGQTVIRGGYGLYYGRIQNGTIYQALIQTGSPAGQFNYLLTGNSAGAPIYPNVFAQGQFPTSGLNLKVFDQNMRLPAVKEGDLIVEQQLPWKTVLSVNYLLSLGQRLPNFVDSNLAPATRNQGYVFAGGPLNGQTYSVPFYTQRINPAYGQITRIVSNVRSNYNGLVTQLEHRFDHNISFSLSYTWSKALDNGMNETLSATGNAPFDPFQQSLDYGPSIDNQSSRFVGNVVWSPTVKIANRISSAALNGWTFSTIATTQSGVPYSWNVSGGATGGLATTLNGSNGANYVNSLGRDSRMLPGIKNVDLRGSRSLSLAEKLKLRFELESFNIFNHQNITGVNTTAYTVTGSTLTYQSSFGTPNAAGNTVYRERQIQGDVRLSF